MKTKSIILSLLLGVALLAGCSGERKEHSAGHHDHSGHSGGDMSTSHSKEPKAPLFQVDEEFQKQLAEVFSAYVELKDAFVDSNVDEVKSESKEAKDALANVDMKLLSGAAHHDWMTYVTPMQESLDQIASASDIERQRTAFSALSQNLYQSIKAFGLGGEKTAYYEFCPMAFDNTGGYWLSDEEKIRNPYFGDRMLTCGEVKEKLK